MDLARLVAEAAKRALEEHPGAIGVSFSPLSISSKDLERVPAEVRKVLGKGIYFAGSAPGVRTQSGERVFISGDETAAERATAWRNEVRVANGEHLVYVSVEEHGKASGLRDCLRPVSEADLVDALLAWIEGPDSGLPKGLGEALRDAGLDATRSLTSLTSFAAAASTDGSRGKAWSGVASHLPLLGLVKDSGIKAADAAARLAANVKIVTSALTGESRRRSGSGPTADVEERLRRSLREAPETERAKVLGEIDLGAVKTKGLGPKPKQPKPTPKPVAPPKAVAAGRGKAQPATADDRRAARNAQKEATKGEGDGTKLEVTREAEARPNSTHRLHAPALSEGLASLLADLDRGLGVPVRVVVKGGARECLAALPRNASRESLGSPRLQERFGAEFARWSDARRAAIAAIEAHARPQDVDALLVGAMPRLLSVAAIAAALRLLLEALTELFRLALEDTSTAQFEAMHLETVEICDPSGVALRIFGPLHVLSLSQAVAKSEALATGERLGGTAKRLVNRAAGATPAAPQKLTEGEVDLALARAEAGLIVYERAPDATLGRPVEELAESLVRRYLELCPHACFRLRVALYGGDEAAFVVGLVRALDAVPELRLVELLCARPPRLERNTPVAAAFEAGRIRLEALPLQSEGIAEAVPHLVVRFVAERAVPQNEVPSSPELPNFSAAGASPSSFEVRPHCLRVSTPVEGAGAKAFEALHASLRGRVSVGAFVSDHAALSLKSVTPPHGYAGVTWHAIVAPSIGRRPPLGFHLIAHERVDGAQCAVIARELRPLTRALQDGLGKLGVAEPRPNALRGLGAKLSNSTAAALLSLGRRSELQLLAGVLSLEIVRHAEANALVVAVDSAQVALLTGGAPDDHEEHVVMLAVWPKDGKLAAAIGFATADARADVDLSGAVPKGKVGEVAGALRDVWELAAAGAGLEGMAAREFLSWLIWPVLAAEDGGPPGVQEALRAWQLRAEAPGLLMVLPPPLATKVPRGKKTKFSVLSLEPALFNKLLLA
jgi:hypothetical protein